LLLHRQIYVTVQISVMVVISARTYNALRWRVQDVTQTNTTNEAHGAAEGPQRETTRSVSGLGEVGVPERRSAGPALHGRNTGSSAHPKQRFFVPFQGRILAEYYGGSTRGTLFDHPDELGSLTTATDYATSHSAERLFYPFGEAAGGSDLYSLGMHQTFGQLPDYDNDSNSDLYNTLNRHYTPMGRWLSPDPGGLKVVRFDDPQTWNMYAYVRNNPTTLTDPTGLIGYGFWWYLKRAARLLEPPLPPPPPSLVLPPPGAPHVEYKQSNGDTSVKIGSSQIMRLGTGYAGHNKGLNNPANQNVPEDKKDPKNDNAGPPPQGQYGIGPMRTIVVTAPDGRRISLTASMRLTPAANNEMFDRGGFLIHGGNFRTMDSSQGCIIEHLDVRSAIGNSGIKDLEVVP
jgi:RHS repeat-associated protein